MRAATHDAEGALFDFDGTLTRRDTMAGFLIHAGRQRPLRGLALAVYALVAAPLWAWAGRRSALLSGALYLLTVGRGRAEIHALVRGYARALAADRGLMRPEVVAAARRHAAAGRAIWVVSGSPALWIRAVLRTHGIRARVIGSRCLVRGRGLVLERRCVGREKVARVVACARGRAIRWRHAYGDQASDRPLLGLAERATWC